MADTQQKFDFTQSVSRLEEINAWFQNEDFNLDEGLQKLREGHDLIKKCRSRLKAVENEFVQIKQEFAEGTQEEDLEVKVTETQKIGGTQRKVQTEDIEEVSPDEIPY